jgi:predicted dehydrogenase
MITKPANPTPFQIHRRRFLQTTAAITAASGVPAWFLELERAHGAQPTKPLGPNERPGVALVGCGGQGRGDCGAAAAHGNVVAVCDVDDRQTEAAAKQFTKDGRGPQKYKDFRKLMERDDIHVVVNGTPDHWHTLINLLAVKTGKDVYSEKPLTLTIDEGKRLVEAVRRNQRIVQVGSQQRSDRNFRLACELVRNGRIGKLQHMIVGLPTGPVAGPFPEKPVPAEMDWDYYLGQAKFMPYNGKNAHWDFRWWYAFSGGQMTDWGAHHNDIAQWANGTERSGPVEIHGKSLVDMIPGGFDAAAKYRIECKYANGVTMTIVDESTVTDRNVVGEGKKTPNGVQFLGSNGWIYVARGALSASSDDLLHTPLPDSAIKLYRSSNHMGNFFESIRSRKDPICDVEIGHRSITVAHLGVISVRMGQALRWDPAKEKFTGSNAREANKWLAREQRKPYGYGFIS